MLALPFPDPTLYDHSENGSIVVASMSAKQKKLEQAGLGYEKLKVSIFGPGEPIKKPDEPEDSSSVSPPKSKRGKGKKRKYSSSSSEQSDGEMEANSEQKRKFNEAWAKRRDEKSAHDKDRDAAMTEDHYQILGLDEFKIIATENQIKTAYRKLALEYHPDKRTQAAETTESSEANEKLQHHIWLKIQKAYETLLDAEKKRAFDSSLPFDDEYPSDDEITPTNFYELFDPVFKRNAIWSKRKPVPEIGNHATPNKKVKRFYRFWIDFETWRDFSCHDEHTLDDAGDRYEKRWMEKEN